MRSPSSNGPMGNPIPFVNYTLQCENHPATSSSLSDESASGMASSNASRVCATSWRAIPRSTVSNTFSERSFEYAFSPGRFHEDQTSRNPPL
jgi:hypothetical protein